jgi:phenylpyruvate tautomerase PptA (4-oxalocrotonate tautomerase family)
MPTYVCSVPEGSLTITQKPAVAEAIARIHSEATGAPQFFVQVIIDENQSVDRFLGGQLTTNHIWIRGDRLPPVNQWTVGSENHDPLMQANDYSNGNQIKQTSASARGRMPTAGGEWLGRGGKIRTAFSLPSSLVAMTIGITSPAHESHPDAR